MSRGRDGGGPYDTPDTSNKKKQYNRRGTGGRDLIHGCCVVAVQV